MNNSLPQLALIHEESVSAELFNDFSNAISTENLDFRIEVRPENGPQAGLELLVFTTVFIWISKSYFDSFLREAAKDHYPILKKAIAALWSKFFGDKREVRVCIIGTAGKVNPRNRYSFAFSIVAESGFPYRFKLLLEDDISNEEFYLAVSSFLDFLRAIYASGPTPAIEEYSRAFSAARMVLVTYDKDIHAIVLVEPFIKNRDQP